MFKGFVREGELRRWAPWAGAAFLILVAVALGTSMESVCWDEEAAKAAKVNEAAGCFEFWFYRYQTLIGAVSAIGAAWYAGVWVSKQIERTDKQIDLTQAQISADRLPHIEETLRRLANLFLAVGKIDQIYSRLILYAKKTLLNANYIYVDYSNHFENRAVMESLGLYEKNAFTEYYEVASHNLSNYRAQIEELKGEMKRIDDLRADTNYGFEIGRSANEYLYKIDDSISNHKRLAEAFYEIIELEAEPDLIFLTNMDTLSAKYARLSEIDGIQIAENIRVEIVRLRKLRDTIVERAEKLAAAVP